MTRRDDAERLVDGPLGLFATPPAEEMAAAQGRTAYRIQQQRLDEAMLATESRTLRPTTSRWWAAAGLLGAAAVVVLIVRFALPFAAKQPDMTTLARVVDGDDLIYGPSEVRLASGAAIAAGELVRTSTKSNAELGVADGSRVEIRSGSTLAFERADNGIVIRLQRGGIIVNAAAQHDGRLYVRTRDMTVSVVGTVFLVNAEEKGSRVAVIEGQVHVRQGALERNLRPGEQVITNPDMNRVPVEEGIAWSRRARERAALLQQAMASSAPRPAASQAPLSAAGAGQTPGQPPLSFEVAKLAVSMQSKPGMRGGVLRGTRYELRNATMLDLIRTAFSVPAEKISGGPSWLEWNRFDIAALAPERSSPEQLREMLKTLLAERFKLVVHDGTVTVTGMALRTRGTPRLREASTGGSCQAQLAPDADGVPLQSVACKGQSTAQLAETLRRVFASYFADVYEIVDETGLTGRWDFDIKMHPRGVLARAGANAIPLDKALADIGLKVDLKDIPVPGIVVDTVSSEFTPNPPDVDRRMPLPDVPRFEVATLRPSAPDATGPTRAQVLPTGINAANAPLKQLISVAWDVPASDINGPEWLESNKYDLTARVSTDSTPGANTPQDDESIRKMLQALVLERFQIKYHMEERLVPAYTIRADNPKMTKADGAKRTRCVQGAFPGTPAAARAPQFGRQFSCQNMTVAQFAVWLPTVAAGYTRVPAVDMSGINGGYDFTLDFSPAAQVQGPRSDSGAVASDPTGGLSLPDAVRRQLGLRLEDTKRAVLVMVIESAREIPTDN